MGECSASPATDSSTWIPPHPMDHQPHFPTAAHLHSLMDRFRRSSNAESATSDTSHEHEPTKEEIKAEAVRSAKRFLHAAVRDDWEFPVRDDAVHRPTDTREPLSYRQRAEGASDIDSDASKRSPVISVLTKVISNPYRFERPDSVTSAMNQSRHKRRRLVDQEMQWNVGLRNWSSQRDAWTGAVRTRPRRRKSRAKSEPDHPSPSPEISTEQPPNPDSPHRDSANTTSSEESIIPPRLSNEGPYLPILPPLLPDTHPVRANIKPAAYPTIYSKVVIQSLTPTVPVPLPHLIKSLVEGWKAEGNWPPKDTPLAAERGLKFRKRTNGEKGRVRKGLRKVKQAFHTKQDGLVDGLEMEFDNIEEKEGETQMEREVQVQVQVAHDVAYNKHLLEDG